MTNINTNTSAVAYMDNAQVAALVMAGRTYQKCAQTALRKVRDDEIGQTLVTYVKTTDGTGVRKESESVLDQSKVLARNNNVIGVDEAGQDIYNEWPMSIETAVKNYGQDVVDSLSDTTFSLHKKKAKLQAVVLDRNILDILGVSGDVLHIKVSWSDEPMVAHLGDFLADGGYSVSLHDMKDYEAV